MTIQRTPHQLYILIFKLSIRNSSTSKSHNLLWLLNNSQQQQQILPVYVSHTHTHTLSFPLKTNAFVRKCKNSRNSERRISDWLRLGLQQRKGWARGQRKGGSNSARRRAGACAREPASSHDIAIFAWEMHESQASACSQRQERRKKEALQEETRSRAQLSDGSTSPTACAYAFFLLAR